jgi:hypothetical protein
LLHAEKSPPSQMTAGFFLGPSLRANGSRERAPDDRLREAIQLSRNKQEAGLLRRKGSSQ